MELASLSTKQLIGELCERSPALVVAAILPEENAPDTIVITAGHKATCLGLATLAHQQALSALLTPPC